MRTSRPGRTRARLARAVLLFGALALIIAACGAEEAPDDTAAEAPAEDPGEAPAEDPDEAPDEAPEDAEPATDYPTQDVRLVVPFGAGGGYDTQARIIAPHLERHLPNDVNVVVDNVPGADGIQGPQQVFNADPDGYQILQAGVNSLLIVQVLNPDLVTYDMTEFSYIGQYQRDLRGVGLANELDVESWDELVAMSEEEPLRAGGTGAGSPPTTEVIALSELTGLQIEIIDYEGSAELQAAFARGELDIAVVNYTSILRWQDDGDAQLWMVIADERGDYAPDTPTAVERGMDQDLFDTITQLPVIGQPRMFMAPPGTPDDVLQVLRDAFWAVMEDPEYLAEVEERQEIYVPLDGEASAEVVQQIADRISEEMELIEELYGD